MERLTKKSENKYWLNWSYDEQDAIQQLGKLEDLQDELGIPLEVLFKALKEGFYVRFVGLPARRLPEYTRFDFYNKKIDECNIKDYGKTWSLDKKDLEDK